MENNNHNTHSVSGRVNDPATFARFASVKSYQDHLKDKDNPVVMVTLTLGGKDFLDRATFETYLTQHTNAHDEFTIVVSDTAIDDFNGQVMKNSKNLLGESITIHFHLKGTIVQSFKGIIANICNKKNEGGGYGSLHISGFAPSILLDSGKECQSYENKTLKEIVAEATKEYSNITINTEGMVNTKYQIPYVVQYKESDYQFIQRLARRYGEFFYYNGTQLQFNNETQKTVTLLEGGDLIDVEFELMLKPQHFSYLSYDVATGNMEQKATEEVRLQNKVNPFQFAAIKASEKVFTKKPTVPYNAIPEDFRGDYLKDAVRREKESREQLMQVRGRSRNPHLRIGGFVKLRDINDKPMETYRIIDIKHHQSGYDYENEFVAIPDVYIAYYYDEQALPKAEQQVARVIDNNDPKGLGRVRVQFIWQEKHQTKTPWIRVVQPHAGGGKGFYFIPEKGEEVWVDFEGQNAERPYVLGSNYNGKEYSPFHNKNNDIKAIQTRSGVKIKINDSNGSLFLEDPSGNSIYMDGKQKISFNGATLEFNAQRIIMNATERTEITTNDYILNALNKIYVFSSWFKQQINGFMHLFSNSALINTTNAIDIEAKEAKLLGTEKSIVHSDNVAVVNSLGTAELKGKQGNKYTQKAEEVPSTPAEEIGLAVVHFRPLDSWCGEFGFDWFRIEDSSLSLPNEEDYLGVLEGGYNKNFTNGTRQDLSPQEAYKSFSEEYKSILIKGNPDLPGFKYYVPYLTMFSKEFIDILAASPNPPRVFPKYEVELQLLISISEEIKELKFVYEKEYFEIDKTILPYKTKQNLEKSGTVKIICLKDLDSDKEIKVYAYPKDGKGEESKVLAGKLIVLKNDHTARQEQKIVLVKVKTDVQNTGKIKDGEIASLYSFSYQSLIVPLISEALNILDLSSDKRFKVIEKDKEYVYGEFTYNYKEQKEKNPKKHKDEYIDKAIWQNAPNFFSEVKKAFLNDKNEDGLLKNKIYEKGYQFIFLMEVETYDERPGEGEEIGGDNAILFKSNRYKSTMAHEFFHCLGLYHTHREDTPIKEANRKYIFKKSTTTNLMSYVQGKTKSLWHWQWLIVKLKLSQKC